MNNIQPIFNLNSDMKSAHGEAWIGNNFTKIPFRKSYEKSMVHFRHCVTNVIGQNNKIIIGEEYYCFDYMSNMMVSFDTVPVFANIKKLIVNFGDSIVLDCTGLQLECIMKLYPEHYRKIISYTNKFIIPIQYILMLNQLIMFRYPITINLEFIDDLNINNLMATFEGFRTIDESYRRSKAVSNEKYIYTYYFHEYKNSSKLIIDTPPDVPISTIIITGKNLNVKLGNYDVLPATNPYFDYNDVIIPSENTYCYISRPVSIGMPNLNSMTGLIFGHTDLKLDVESDINTDVEVLYVINNAFMSDAYQKTSLMLPISYSTLNQEIPYGSPLSKIDDNNFIEGYWGTTSIFYNERKYPLPIVTDVAVDGIFLKKLEKVMANNICENFFGSSNCRVCGEKNGCGEYTLVNGVVKFTVPEGIMHYYTVHNVHPSEEFYEFVMDYNLF